MLFKNWFAWLRKLIVGDSNLNEETSEISYLSVREILSKHPVKSIICYRAVCKAYQRSEEELSDKVVVSKEDGVQKSHVSDFSLVSELPDSVIFEILMKLPIERIIQCKRVIKSWNRLISDPFFANVYFKNSPCNASVISQHRTYTDHERARDPDDQFFNYIEAERNGEITRTPLDLKALVGVTKEKRSWKTIIGSCDGLLCIVETPCEEELSFMYSQTMFVLKNPNQTVWIGNPLIGEYMALPKVRGANDVHVVYGFGSTVDGNHYKVVRVAMQLSRVAETQILTIGVDNEWRDLDGTSPRLQLFSNGVTLNGVLHWVGVEACQNVIYAFDIADETGHCLMFPSEIRHWPNEIFVAVWNGLLCITHNTEDLQFDMWTMRQYGFVESWTRDAILTHSSPFFFEAIPITTMRNGDLLLFTADQGSLFSFDPVTKKLVKLEGSSDLYNSYTLVGYAFAPSFVSPRDIVTTR